MSFRPPALALVFAASAFAAGGPSQVEKVVRRIEASRSLPRNLRTLCAEIGPRMAGTAGMRRAVAWARSAFEEASVDSVEVEPVPMPLRWEEGKTGVGVLGGQGFPIRAASSALSPATPRDGIEAEAAYAGIGSPGHILRRRGELADKLLLIRLHEVDSFEGLAVEQRDAMIAMREAAEIGAAGVLFVATRPNGLMYRHVNGIQGKIDPLPSAVLAREDGLRLLRALEDNPSLRLRLDLPNKIGGGYDTHNVMAEIRGSERPREIVLLGAHLDSWDMGAGCLDNASNAAAVVEARGPRLPRESGHAAPCASRFSAVKNSAFSARAPTSAGAAASSTTMSPSSFTTWARVPSKDIRSAAAATCWRTCKPCSSRSPNAGRSNP